MNELWIVGFTGAALGGALGWPMLRASNSFRLLGSLLLLGAVAAGVIAARHGAIVPAGVAGAAAHLTQGGNLLFWAGFVVWVRAALHLRMSAPIRTALFVVPLAGYGMYVLRYGDVPQFVWLLPAGTAASAYAYALWWRHPGARGCGLGGALLTRMIAFGIALNLAQAVRTFLPGVEVLREIVPITMTACFFSLAAVVVRHILVTPPASANATVAAPAYAKSALDANGAEKLLASLEAGMRDQHWYREPDLSLTALGMRLETRPGLLSQALNQVKRITLNDYLTTWRVAEARRLLLDPTSDRFTIDALAESAGFASRSAFYKAFKAHEGMPPTEFRTRNRAALS
jgi:AraC-like DNA-binding protein